MMKRQKIKAALFIVGFTLFLAEVLLGALSLYSVTMDFVNPSLALEFRTVGGMNPRTYYMLLMIVPIASFWSLFLAGLILPADFNHLAQRKLTRRRISVILIVAGFFLFFAEIFLVFLTPFATGMWFIDSSLVLEFYPVGGMSPQVYYTLLVLVFFASFLSLFLANLIPSKRAKSPEEPPRRS
jgi:hypothetical protein